MPRMIDNHSFSYKKSLFLFLIGQISTSVWATNIVVTTNPDNNQRTINSTHNALVVRSGGNLTTTNSDAIIFDNTAPGTNPLINDIVASVSPPIINGNVGTAIIVLMNGSINAPNGKLAINAADATSVGGGNIFINNAGNISVDTPVGTAVGNIINMGMTTAAMKLTNSGSISGNIVGSKHGDILNNSGTIAGNIIGGIGGSVINITGVISPPRINGNIITSSLGNNVLNIGNLTSAADFYTEGLITNIQVINVKNTAGTNRFNIRNPITGVINNLTTASTTITTISDAGDLSGGGVIQNGGTISLSGIATIGNLVPMGAVTNSGTITANGGDIKIGAITNLVGGTINIQNANTTTGLDGSNTLTNAGTLNITNGDLSSVVFGTILNNSGTLTLSNTGTMMNSPGSQLGDINNSGVVTISNTQGLNINGEFINNHVNYGTTSPNISLAITNCNVYIGNIYNTLGSITIGAAPATGGDLSSIDVLYPSIINNAVNQTITISGTGTIGANATFGALNNKGIINANGGNIKIGTFNNNANNALLHITSNNFTTDNINNNSGTINISGGNLAAMIPGTTTLTNAVNQSINISGTGTIGADIVGIATKFGTVTNNGIINAGGGDVKIGNFINNATDAYLNITKNTFKSGNITNNLGTINIGANAVGGNPELGGDLSSIDDVHPSTLTNDANQIITIAGTGTIGDQSRLGTVLNSGIMNAGGGDLYLGSFTNNGINALLNITSGTVLITGDINNTLGTVVIGDLGSSGDLSSTGNLINSANQIITVAGAGTIGANHELNIVTNSGIINAGGGDIKIVELTNNSAMAALNITSGKLQFSRINNNLGKINIIGNGLVAADLSGTTDDSATLTNATNQVITITENGSIGCNNQLASIVNNGIINATTSVGFKAGEFINHVGATTIINNSATTSINTGVNLTSIENSGIFSISNTENINDVSLGQITNNVGSIFNINGPITAIGNFTNQQNAVVNIGAPIDVGVGNTFTNNGTVNILTPVTITNGGYTVESTGIHILAIENGLPKTLSLSNGSCEFKNSCTIEIKTDGDHFLFKDNQTFNVVSGSAAATLGGDISIIGNTNLVSFTPSIAPNNNDILLTSHRVSVAKVLENLKNNTDDLMTSSVSTVGPVLDHLINTGVKGDLGLALVNLEKLDSMQGVKYATDQLLPEINYVAQTSFDNPTMAFSATEVRLDTIARYDINHIRTGITGYAAGGMQANDGVWVKGLVSSNLQKHRDAFPGYNANSYGSVFGLDNKILSNTWLGIAGSFVGSQIKSKDFPAKRTDVKSYQTTLYLSHSNNNYYIDGLVGMAFNTYKTLRNIQFSQFYREATAKFTGLQPAFKLHAGHIKQVDNFRLIPNVSLQYSLLRQRSYTETGAGNASLKVDNADLKQLEVGVGFKLAMWDQEKENFIFNPDIHFMFLHDFKAEGQATVAEFAAGGGKFTLQGITPNKDTYNVGAGLTLISYDSLHFTANYEVRMKDKFVGHSGSIAVRYEF